MGTEIGNAETVIRFGKSSTLTAGSVGTFSLMRVDTTYYSSKGKKKGQKLDLRNVSYWIPMLVTQTRPYEKALEELIETIADQQHAKPDVSSDWHHFLDSGSTDEIRVVWKIRTDSRNFPTPFKVEDVPQRKEIKIAGGGPIW